MKSRNERKRRNKRWYCESIQGQSGQWNRSVFGWDDHHGVTTLWPPHQHLGIIGIGLDHGIRGDRLILAQDLGLFLGHGLVQNGPLTQRLFWVHFDVKPHPPADCLQDEGLWGGLVDGHQPGRKALVAVDAAKLRHVAVTDRHTPGHTGVEIVVHTNGELAVLLGGAYNCAGLRGVAVPWVVDAIRVTDGLNLPVTQVGQLPTRPGSRQELSEIELMSITRLMRLKDN